jgi:6-phosphofructokinase 1
MRVRMVDIHSDRYKIARSYMLRLRKEDFDDPAELSRLAQAAGISVDEMKRQFRGLVQSEPGPMSLHSVATEPR